MAGVTGRLIALLGETTKDELEKRRRKLVFDLEEVEIKLTQR